MTGLAWLYCNCVNRRLPHEFGISGLAFQDRSGKFGLYAALWFRRGAGYSYQRQTCRVPDFERSTIWQPSVSRHLNDDPVTGYRCGPLRWATTWLFPIYTPSWEPRRVP
jgi:hypothetical protein